MDQMLDNSKKTVLLFAVLALVGVTVILLISPISGELSTFNRADTALKNWDSVKITVTKTKNCGHGLYCILDNYTYKNAVYSPEGHLTCYGNCVHNTVEILVNPADPTDSITKERAIRDQELNSNPFTFLFNIAGFVCLGIPFVILVIIVIYLKTRKLK